MFKTLIVAPNWIGDAVMTLPLLDHLSNNHKIDVLAHKIVEPIYKHAQCVNDIIIHDFPHKKMMLMRRMRLASQLRTKQYTHVYVLPNSIKSLFIPFVAGISNKIAYNGEWPRKYLLTHCTPNLGKKILMVEHYAYLAKFFGANKNNTISGQLQPKLYIDKLHSENYLNSIDLKDNTYIAFAIGAEYGLAKQWPIDNFKELISLMYESVPHVKIILLGSAKDQDFAKNLQINDNVMNLCGITSLTQAMYVIHHAKSILTHDSGLMHIAAAIGTPTVALYGSSSPEHTPPLSNQAQYIWLKKECSPCFERTCKFGHYNCLKDITPQHVFEKLC